MISAASTHIADGRHGGILIGALVFVFVISLMLAGLATVTVSHFTRANVETSYVAALYAAEAGACYELRKISENAANADQAGSGSVPGVTYSMPGGAFTVYCTNRDGSTPWTPGQYLTIVSTGVVNGATRTINVAAQGYGGLSSSIFAVTSANFSGSAQINGSIETDGKLTASGSMDVTGNVVFDGPSAGWQAESGSIVATAIDNPQAVTMQTVDQIALAQFPASTYPPGGLAYLATHNNNAALGLGTTLTASGSGTTTLTAGNYYFTSINMSGSHTITFNNATGTINVWIGPLGGSGGVNLSGANVVVPLSTSPNVHIYVATTGGVNVSGSSGFNVGIYDYTVSSGQPVGTINASGSTTITGQLVASTFNFSGSVVLNGIGNMFGQTNYYGFANAWVEVNGAY
jgi:hypothetical protein